MRGTGRAWNFCGPVTVVCRGTTARAPCADRTTHKREAEGSGQAPAAGRAWRAILGDPPMAVGHGESRRRRKLESPRPCAVQLAASRLPCAVPVQFPDPSCLVDFVAIGSALGHVAGPVPSRSRGTGAAAAERVLAMLHRRRGPQPPAPARHRQPARPDGCARTASRASATACADAAAPYRPGEFELFVQRLAQRRGRPAAVSRVDAHAIGRRSRQPSGRARRLRTSVDAAEPAIEIRRFGAELMTPSGAGGAAPTSARWCRPTTCSSPATSWCSRCGARSTPMCALVVDRSGRISMPRVGPVMVAGVRYADLADGHPPARRAGVPQLRAQRLARPVARRARVRHRLRRPAGQPTASAACPPWPGAAAGRRAVGGGQLPQHPAAPRQPAAGQLRPVRLPAQRRPLRRPHPAGRRRDPRRRRRHAGRR